MHAGVASAVQGSCKPVLTSCSGGSFNVGDGNAQLGDHISRHARNFLITPKSSEVQEEPVLHTAKHDVEYAGTHLVCTVQDGAISTRKHHIAVPGKTANTPHPSHNVQGCPTQSACFFACSTAPRASNGNIIKAYSRAASRRTCTRAQSATCSLAHRPMYSIHVTLGRRYCVPCRLLCSCMYRHFTAKCCTASFSSLTLP